MQTMDLVSNAPENAKIKLCYFLQSAYRTTQMKKFILSALLVIANAVASSDDFIIALGLWIPPYVFKNENRGIELEILQKVLALARHKITTHYVPLRLTITELAAQASMELCDYQIRQKH
jgi:hypothetical protein